MSDILLKNDGDFDLTEGRLSLITTQQELTAQRLSIKLRTYRGEWYLDLSEGIPYFQRIFKRSSNAKAVADTIFKNEINNDDGVISLNSFTSQLSNTGVYSLSFNVTTVSGDIVTVEQNINF